jgi:putative transposase
LGAGEGERISQFRFLIRDLTQIHCRLRRGLRRRRAQDPAHTDTGAEGANAYAERWMGSLRRELLDRMLILSRGQLKAILSEYVDHYNT